MLAVKYDAGVKQRNRITLQSEVIIDFTANVECFFRYPCFTAGLIGNELQHFNLGGYQRVHSLSSVVPSGGFMSKFLLAHNFDVGRLVKRQVSGTHIKVLARFFNV